MVRYEVYVINVNSGYNNKLNRNAYNMVRSVFVL